MLRTRLCTALAWRPAHESPEASCWGGGAATCSAGSLGVETDDGSGLAALAPRPPDMCVRMIHEQAREASKSHIRVNHSCTQGGGHAMAQLGAAWRCPRPRGKSCCSCCSFS